MSRVLTETLVAQPVEGALAVGPLARPVAIVNPDGTPFAAGSSKGAAVAPVASADAAPAAAETVTKAEFDKAVAVANECKGQLNALISSLKAAGALA